MHQGRGECHHRRTQGEGQAPNAQIGREVMKRVLSVGFPAMHQLHLTTEACSSFRVGDSGNNDVFFEIKFRSRAGIFLSRAGLMLLGIANMVGSSWC